MNSYLEQVNKKETNPVLVSLLAYADQHEIPIITRDGLELLCHIILLNDVKKVLEIGTAIAYSSIAMVLKTNVNVTTIERNPDMIKLATKNIKEAGLEHKIKLIEGDALEVDESTLGTFDLLFIDAAKAQSIKFFEKYETIVKSKGVIVTDNLLFHGLVDQEILDRNLRQLVTKIDRFNHYVVERSDYHTYIYDIGDGMSISMKKE